MKAAIYAISGTIKGEISSPSRADLIMGHGQLVPDYEVWREPEESEDQEEQK